MSAPCEKVADHPNHRPPLRHSSLCTLTTDYLQSKWCVCWEGVRLFSVSVVLTCFMNVLCVCVFGTNVFGADSEGCVCEKL